MAVARHPLARIAPPAPAIISASRAREGSNSGKIWRADSSELRRADRPARAAWAAADRRRRFHFSDFRFGATMELGRSGRLSRAHDHSEYGQLAIDDDVGGRRPASAASYGVIDNRSKNLQRLQRGRAPRTNILNV
jgi:hypothetical protein